MNEEYDKEIKFDKEIKALVLNNVRYKALLGNEDRAYCGYCDLHDYCYHGDDGNELTYFCTWSTPTRMYFVRETEE